MDVYGTRNTEHGPKGLKADFRSLRATTQWLLQGSSRDAGVTESATCRLGINIFC